MIRCLYVLKVKQSGWLLTSKEGYVAFRTTEEAERYKGKFPKIELELVEM